MQTLLKIVTVTKDDPEGVAATINSTRRLRGCQGVRQVIVDGSGELLRRKVEAIADAEENVDYLWQEPIGIAHAFNQGISRSESDWFWFLNGRDEAHPDLDPFFLLRLLAVTQSDIMICELEFMQSESRQKHPPLWALWPPLYWVPHPATLIRGGLFHRYGFFDEQYAIAMDGELWVRLFTKDVTVDMLSVPICLFDQNGVSSRDRVNVEREADRIIIDNLALLFKLWISRGHCLFTALRRSFMSRFIPGKWY